MVAIELMMRLQETGPVPLMSYASAGCTSAMAVRAMKAGASDVLSRPIEKKGLLQAICRREPVSMPVGNLAAREMEIRAPIGKLTRRQRQVMNFVASGLTSRQIASQLNVSIKTVEAHRARIMNKTTVNSLAELVRIASRLSPE